MPQDNQIGLIRAIVRLALERDFAANPGEISVPKCPYKGCETKFIGANLEDYAVHLVKEHPLHRSSQKRLYHALTKEIRRAEDRQNIS